MAKFALLIGISNYGSGFNSLAGTLKDVEVMRRILQHPDIGGFDVETLKNPNPLEMQLAIEGLFKEKVRHLEDIVLLYFSGHCIKDHQGKLYFSTSITRKNPTGELAKSTAVAASFIQEIMNDSKAKRQIIILDCCFSNAFADVVSAINYGSVDVENQLTGEGRVILTSSISIHHFFKQKGMEISTYTQYLAEGIETGAADFNRDSWIDIKELHEYVSRKAEATASTMEPEIYGDEESCQILLTKVPITQSLRVTDQTKKNSASKQQSNEVRTKNAAFPYINSPIFIGACFVIVSLIGAAYALRRSPSLQSSPTQISASRQYTQVQSFSAHTKTVWSLAVTPDGQTLVSSSGDEKIKVWQLPSGKLLHTLTGHLDTVWSVAISPDGNTLVSGSGDQTIKVWELSTGKLLRTLSEPNSTVWSVAISPDGQQIVSGDTNKVKIWQLQTGKLLHTISGNQIRAVAISPNGQQIAAGGSGDGSIKIWQLSDGTLRTFSAQKSRIISIAFSPNGQMLTSGSNDQTIDVWNIATGSLLHTLAGHTDHVNAVAISANGVLASGAEDHLVKLWNLRTGSLMQTLSGHTQDIYAVAITLDGRTVVSGDKRGNIKIWSK